MVQGKEVRRLGSISITAEPNGFAVWLEKEGDIALRGCRLMWKEALGMAREIAISMGAESGLSVFSDGE